MWAASYFAATPDTSGWPPLVRSVWQSSPITAVQKLLDDGAKVNAVDKQRCTALFRAAWRGKLPIVKLLLAHGADPNIPSMDGSTPLRKSLTERHGDVALCLLEHGARVHDMASTLKLCIVSPFAHQEAILRHLLVAGGNTALKSMPCALHDAIVAKLPVHIMELFVGHGAPIQASALVTAVKDGYRDAVKWLIASGCSVNGDKDQPLMAAVASQQLTILKDLIKAGADVNMPSAKGVTPLLKALHLGLPDFVFALEQAGAKYEGPALALDQALLGAASRLGVTECRRLLAAGATNVTPALLKAAEVRRQEVVSELLGHGASVNWADDNGSTAIFQCFKNAKSDADPFTTLRCLIEAGANVNAVNARGVSPLQQVLSLEHPSTRSVKALLDAGAVLQPPFNGTANPFAVIAQCARLSTYDSAVRSIIGMLLDAGYDVNAPISATDPRTALQKAVRDSKLKAVHFLVDAGARADRLPTNDLHILASDPRCLLAAMEAGAKVPFRDAEILHWNFAFTDESERVARECIADGAVVTGLNRAGLSLVDLEHAQWLPDLVLVAGLRLQHARTPDGQALVHNTLCKWAGDSSLYTRHVHLNAWLRRRAGIQLWHAVWTSEE